MAAGVRIGGGEVRTTAVGVFTADGTARMKREVMMAVDGGNPDNFSSSRAKTAALGKRDAASNPRRAAKYWIPISAQGAT